MKKLLILFISILLVSNTAFCANTKGSKNSNKQTINVHKLTPKQKEVRKQMFNNAVNSGMNRSKAYNLYY